MPTLEPHICHKIDPLDVLLVRSDRPDVQSRARVVFEVGDRFAVASAHNEGFWVLPLGFGPFAERPGNMNPVDTEWVPHMDARFPSTVRR